uniref:Uncharacterized protein n=1 Tax=Cyanoderma ruficeps TaxID=181631 RepID=A0A8C3P0Z6_9PASS
VAAPGGQPKTEILPGWSDLSQARPLLGVSGTGSPEPGWGTPQPLSTLPLPHHYPLKFCWRVSSAWKEPNLNYSRGKETQNLREMLLSLAQGRQATETHSHSLNSSFVCTQTMRFFSSRHFLSMR